MTNTAKWADVYDLASGRPKPYGDTATYILAREWLSPCLTVADFGCGYGYFAGQRDRVTGYDASNEGEGIVRWNLVDDGPPVRHFDGGLIRHVLEHEPQWQEFLRNAAMVCRDRLCVILFTPLVDQTETIATYGSGIIDQALSIHDLTHELADSGFTIHESTSLRTDTQYGGETVFSCLRRVAA